MSKAKKQNAVICATCGQKYHNVFSLESNQAYECASDLIEKDGQILSYSHYGSKLDTMKYIFKEQGIYKVGVICDKCIIKAIESDIAKEDKNYNYFATIDDLPLIEDSSDLGKYIGLFPKTK